MQPVGAAPFGNAETGTAIAVHETVGAARFVPVGTITNFDWLMVADEVNFL